jgi:hypothetical protein
MRKLLHHFIAWYLRRCGGAFHTYAYGTHGRYVVLMNEQAYHEFRSPSAKRHGSEISGEFESCDLCTGMVDCRKNGCFEERRI